jgi:hypothetical protein
MFQGVWGAQTGHGTVMKPCPSPVDQPEFLQFFHRVQQADFSEQQADHMHFAILLSEYHNF